MARAIGGAQVSRAALGAQVACRVRGFAGETRDFEVQVLDAFTPQVFPDLLGVSGVSLNGVAARLVPPRPGQPPQWQTTEAPATAKGGVVRVSVSFNRFFAERDVPVFGVLS